MSQLTLNQSWLPAATETPWALLSPLPWQLTRQAPLNHSSPIFEISLHAALLNTLHYLYNTPEVVCRVGEHQHQLAHQCSLCEHFHAYTKCEVQHNEIYAAPCLPWLSGAAEGTWDWGGSEDGACVSTHTLGGSGGMLPQKILLKLGALRSLLRPYLYPNATSPTRVHGESNTSVRHEAFQSL